MKQMGAGAETTMATKTTRRIKRHSIRMVTAVAILALIAGFALASWTSGGFAGTYGQGGFTASGTTALQGTSATSALVIQASSSSVPPSGTTCTAPATGASTTLSQTTSTAICLVTVTPTAGDNIQTITFTWSCTLVSSTCTPSGSNAPASTVYELNVYIGATTAEQTVVYITTPAWSGTTGTLNAVGVIALDLTAASDTSVGSINVLVTQCTGSTVSTCP